MPANRTQGCVLLLAATDYQATIQITWRQLNDDAIPGKKSNPVPHLARDIRQNLVLVFHYHTKPSLRQWFNNRSLDLDNLFVRCLGSCCLRHLAACCYLAAVSATVFICASPFSKSSPTILSMFINMVNPFMTKFFSPDMLHFT